jgi:hypothetical protein
MRSCACLCVFLTGVVLLPGCGPSSIAAVRGRVTCNGKPVGQARLIFNPAPRWDGDREPGKPATGVTDADGSYVLSTYKAWDGALVGKHQVTVKLDDTNPARCKRSKQVSLEVKPGGNELNIELNE